MSAVMPQDGEGGGEHVTSFGVDKPHDDAAAAMAKLIKHDVLGWPRVHAP